MSAPSQPAAAGERAMAELRGLVAAEGEPLAAPLAAEPGRTGMGPLAAAGPRAAADPAAYALVAEAVFEGYLLHFERSRVLADPDPDLALLAGDWFYAVGINRLAALDDPESVRLLSDLIRAVADLRAAGRPELARALWVGRITALSCGMRPDLEAASSAVERAEEGSDRALLEVAAAVAAEHSAGREISLAAEAIDLPPFDR